MFWLLTAGAIALVIALVGKLSHLLIIRGYFLKYFGPSIIRIFEERPLFIIPKGKPVHGAEEVRFPTTHGLTLQGTYFRAAGPRKGLILFGLEFGSNRWAAVQYCTALLESGYDVFTYEPRNQGDSDRDPSYEPLQWVTDKDLADFRAALDYLKSRPDFPTRGIGLFGISKGGSVGLAGAAESRLIRCVVTDGAYAAYTTMVPYMRRWVTIYSNRKRLQSILPDWFYGLIGLACMDKSASNRKVRFLPIERAVKRLSQPLLMIHGGGDTYIKPEMAEALFAKARTTAKRLWLVPGAKHNQAALIAYDEYHRQLVNFFDEHLMGSSPSDTDSAILPVHADNASGAVPLTPAVAR